MGAAASVKDNEIRRYVKRRGDERVLALDLLKAHPQAPCSRPLVARLIIGRMFKLLEEDDEKVGALCEEFKASHGQDDKSQHDFAKKWFNTVYQDILGSQLERDALMAFLEGFFLVKGERGFELTPDTLQEDVMPYQGSRFFAYFVCFVMDEFTRLRKLWEEATVASPETIVSLYTSPPAVRDGVIESDADQEVQPNGEPLSLKTRTLVIADAATITLDHFKLGKYAVDVRVENRATVKGYLTDCHYHPRGFGTDPVPLATQFEWMKAKQVLFTTLLGIGQRLPEAARVRYYKADAATRLKDRKFVVRPSPINDMSNAQDYYRDYHNKHIQQDIHLVMSYSFFDLKSDHPGQNVFNLRQVDQDFPDLFSAAGELNIQKQALHNNDRGNLEDLNEEKVTALRNVFAHLEARDAPALIHCDIGCDEKNEITKKESVRIKKSIGAAGAFCCSDCGGEAQGDVTAPATGALRSLAKARSVLLKTDMLKRKTSDTSNPDTATLSTPAVSRFKYAGIMDSFCSSFTANKIIWAHLGGLSLELIKQDVRQHTAFLRQFLRKHPHVWVDVSWDVIYKCYFDDYADMIGESEDSDEDAPPEVKQLRQEFAKNVVDTYVALFNEFPHRFLSGTDLVCTQENVTFDVYAQALKDTGFIFMLKEGLSEEAFNGIVLGQNYLDVHADLDLVYQAPKLF
ncbi:unnamed protein product [Prorocentrum cordatum]|uniref:Uncharacterized protein n=1 Tax=Prorocentrum cordatum TaxID=2364126 RepID=A0ABN9YE84_9DINO|nr:unnamed protein product [Polarella glacialis]|mmetsp:Transcript_109367/g.310105  ORF Transcript_109367/g.310105 Transcript_109367/m.310105 type:complete len:685 (+) Transcript_109367:68-2122(+)